MHMLLEVHPLSSETSGLKSCIPLDFLNPDIETKKQIGASRWPRFRKTSNLNKNVVD